MYLIDQLLGLWVIGVVIVNVACAIVIGTVAHSKGHKELGWILVAMLLGPIALIAVAGLSDRKSQVLLEQLVRAQQRSEPDAAQRDELIFLGYEKPTAAEAKRRGKRDVATASLIILSIFSIVWLIFSRG